jgi:putative endonuclease
MSDKINTGSKGEKMAAEFLAQKGFEVLVKNYRYKHAEIDLIVKRENWLLFVEVKTRTSNTYGEPEEFVTEFKARKIFEAAEQYIFSTNWQGHVRFDVISIKLGDVPEIEHFEDAIN